MLGARVRTTLRRRAREMRGEDGQLAIGFALLLVVIFMFFALAFDAGLWYFDHRLVQNQVDAAALAGALELPDPGNATTAALNYLAKNGIIDPSNEYDAVTHPQGSKCPGLPAVQVLPSGGPYDRVEVCQRRASAMVFSGLLNVTGTHVTSILVSAHARAYRYEEPSRYAIMVMDPHACPAFDVGGGSQVNVLDGSGTGQGGATWTISDCIASNGALRVGNNGLLTALRHEVNGAINACGTCLVGTRISPASPLEDPWEGLAPPAIPATCTTGTGGGPSGLNFNNGTHTLVPGKYCSSISIGASAKVTALPGAYVLMNADMTVKPSMGGNPGYFCSSYQAPATCTASDDGGGNKGVVFYSTCSPSPCAAHNFDFGGGGGQVRLRGHDDYDGILLWIDRNASGGTISTTEVKVTGGSTTELNGHVYARSSDVNLTGGSSGTPAVLNISVLANTLSVSGNANLVLNWDPVTAPKLERIALIQ